MENRETADDAGDGRRVSGEAGKGSPDQEEARVRSICEELSDLNDGTGDLGVIVRRARSPMKEDAPAAPERLLGSLPHYIADRRFVGLLRSPFSERRWQFPSRDACHWAALRADQALRAACCEAIARYTLYSPQVAGIFFSVAENDGSDLGPSFAIIDSLSLMPGDLFRVGPEPGEFYLWQEQE